MIKCPFCDKQLLQYDTKYTRLLIHYKCPFEFEFDPKSKMVRFSTNKYLCSIYLDYKYEMITDSDIMQKKDSLYYTTKISLKGLHCLNLFESTKEELDRKIDLVSEYE